jgi:RimJ/RimL family protein N-acetyltransferase
VYQRCSVPCELDVPVIETKRLRLRGHALSDYQDCVRLWGNAEVTRHIGGKPQSPEDAWARLLRHFGHWCALGFCRIAE